jgi:colanic acid biosynthesis glycosyl transferase WcaI
MHDYAGHPFPVQLCRELARRGYRITHQYCTSTHWQRRSRAEHRRSGGLLGRATLNVRRIRTVLHRTPSRARASIWGSRGQRIRNSGADLVVMSNVPLLAHAVYNRHLKVGENADGLLQQDVRSDAIGTAARHRLGRYGGAVGLDRRSPRTLHSPQQRSCHRHISELQRRLAQVGCVG